MQVIERKTLSALSKEFTPHFHDETMIAYVQTGTGTAAVDNSAYRIGPGSLVVVPSGIVHSCNPDDLSEWSYSAIFIDPEESDACILSDVHVVRSESPPDRLLSGDVGSIVSWVAGQVEAGTRILSSDHGLVGAGVSAGVPVGGDDPRTRAARWLKDHTDSSVSLEELADAGGMSPYELARQFRSAYGLPPHAYHLNVRVNVAKVLLRQGESPADTAFLTGFCDQSHFHRVFVRHVGLTPGRYRHMVSKGALAE